MRHGTMHPLDERPASAWPAVRRFLDRSREAVAELGIDETEDLGCAQHAGSLGVIVVALTADGRNPAPLPNVEGFDGLQCEGAYGSVGRSSDSIDARIRPVRERRDRDPRVACTRSGL